MLLVGDPLFLCSQEYLRKSFHLFVYVFLEQLLPFLLCEATLQTCPISIIPRLKSPGGVLFAWRLESDPPDDGFMIRATSRIQGGTLNLMWREVCHYGVEGRFRLVGGEGDVIS